MRLWSKITGEKDFLTLPPTALVSSHERIDFVSETGIKEYILDASTYLEASFVRDPRCIHKWSSN